MFPSFSLQLNGGSVARHPVACPVASCRGACYGHEVGQSEGEGITCEEEKFED